MNTITNETPNETPNETIVETIETMNARIVAIYDQSNTPNLGQDELDEIQVLRARIDSLKYTEALTAELKALSKGALKKRAAEMGCCTHPSFPREKYINHILRESK